MSVKDIFIILGYNPDLLSTKRTDGLVYTYAIGDFYSVEDVLQFPLWQRAGRNVRLRRNLFRRIFLNNLS